MDVKVDINQVLESTSTRMGEIEVELVLSRARSEVLEKEVARLEARESELIAALDFATRDADDPR